MTELERPKHLCRHCRLEIPDNAMVCTHCNSYQDWRIYFSFSSTVLALLTALISVISISFPNLYYFVHNPRSEISEPIITMDGTTIRAMVTNKGDAAGMFVQAFVQSEYLAPATKIRLRDDKNASITPGSNILVFDIIPLLTSDESYSNSVHMLELMESKQSPPKTNIVFQFGESDGILKYTTYTLDLDQLFLLMRANFGRCSAVARPDFDNGCIGPGAAPDSPGNTK